MLFCTPQMLLITFTLCELLEKYIRINKMILFFSAFAYNLLILTVQTSLVSANFAEGIRSVKTTRTDNLQSGDKVNLLVANSSHCQDQLNAIDVELSAQCTVISQRALEFGTDLCYMECVCKNETGSFILHEKKCDDERKLRQGREVFCPIQ